MFNQNKQCGLTDINCKENDNNLLIEDEYPYKCKIVLTIFGEPFCSIFTSKYYLCFHATPCYDDYECKEFGPDDSKCVYVHPNCIKCPAIPQNLLSSHLSYSYSSLLILQGRCLVQCGE